MIAVGLVICAVAALVIVRLGYLGFEYLGVIWTK